MRRVRLMLHRVRAHVYFTHNDEPFLLSLAHFEMVPVMLFASKLARALWRRVCHTRRVRLMLRRVRAHADFTYNDEAFLLSLAHVEVVPPTQLTDCWVSTRHAALHACASAPHYALLRCRRHWLTPKMGPPPKWTQPPPPVPHPFRLLLLEYGKTPGDGILFRSSDQGSRPSWLEPAGDFIF